MKTMRVLATLAPIFVAGSAYADGMKAEVIHWWTSGGEAAAIAEFANAFNAAGGEWVDAAVSGGGGDTAQATAVSRILGGDPPTAMQMTMGKMLDDLVDKGMLENLDDLAASENFAEVFPDGYQKAITYDGHVYGIPVNIHGTNWLWYNPDVLTSAGVEAVPTDWASMFAALDAIKAKGEVVPIAVGAQPWQLQQTFDSLLLSRGGPELYNAIYVDKDVDAVRSAGFREVVETFLRLRDYSDPAAANRDWNVAMNMVITGQAGFQLMGDWAKGEVIAAGLTPGDDIGCALLGENGRQDYIAAGDLIAFPKVDDEEERKAQQLLASVVVSPDAQLAFNAKKGSVPARLDADTSSLDACAQVAGAALQDPTQIQRFSQLLVSPDGIGALTDWAGRLWSEPDLSVDEFVDGIANVIASEG